ncbi:hypothetical protein GPECTOR_4g624 [Gonium pectorale]|uniref:Rhodanese domain-containing protein n=1 Tax=Gonium pectorale TaxID=33097 RepID=A0A150GXL1_GONPE|nr:hypothetical protein GPECTOR_4g624 [Gonium pectorale]|eukprot:KXZ54559.1 hypothetical protein GPECTOR_4g624 [Gonium pectorale]
MLAQVASAARASPALRGLLLGGESLARVRFSTNAVLPEISSEELVKVLDAKTPGLLVLDVRSPEELAAGSIKGSLNVPTPVFKQADTGPLDAAINQHIRHAKQVVVHCLFCSPGKRGPTAAAALQKRLEALGVSPAPAVRVLTGGIDAFAQQYGSRTDLITLPPEGWKVQAH